MVRWLVTYLWYVDCVNHMSGWTIIEAGYDAKTSARRGWNLILSACPAPPVCKSNESSICEGQAILEKPSLRTKRVPSIYIDGTCMQPIWGITKIQDMRSWGCQKLIGLCFSPYYLRLPSLPHCQACQLCFHLLILRVHYHQHHQ